MGITTHLLDGGKGNLPLVVEPADKVNSSLDELKGWIQGKGNTLEDTLIEHGAILFRNFPVENPHIFEDIAKLIDPNLKNNYLGTSPRNAVTEYAFSASELPSYYPIMQHCEMSFLNNPPSKLFFYCNIAPKEGGETPIVDFRKVYAQMDPKIRDEFVAKGIRNIRNYNGPESKTKFDLWKLKRWDEMFLTTDTKKVEEVCEQNQLEYHWKGEGKLVLINGQDATIKHPKTGEDVWFNHLQVFHRDAAAIEYSYIRKRQKNMRGAMLSGVVSFATFLKQLTVKSEDQAMHCTFKDGSEIPTSYVKHVEELIWDNMVVFKWQKGDVIAIDNFSTSHGRMPYKGPRDILVCWSADN